MNVICFLYVGVFNYNLLCENFVIAGSINKRKSIMTLNTNQDFLDRKIDICFTHGDQNRNGVLEPADAQALAARIITNIGEPMDSVKAQALFKAFEDSWIMMSAKMDVNGDGKISPEEWRKGIRKTFSEDPNGYKEGFRPLAEAIFNLCDRDDNGSVSQQEFELFHKAFGTSAANSKIAFEKLDANGNGVLSVDELLVAWQEYYTSTDPNARGNWLYGDVWDESVTIASVA
ncbi:MAG: EF-hand domain-containing protein [Gammaproteobacteria bacterium]